MEHTNETTGQLMLDDCVTVDADFELQWVVAVLCELHKEGKLTCQERGNVIEDILENS